MVKIAKTKIDTLKESKKLLRGARDVLRGRDREGGGEQVRGANAFGVMV